MEIEVVEELAFCRSICNSLNHGFPKMFCERVFLVKRNHSEVEGNYLVAVGPS